MNRIKEKWVVIKNHWLQISARERKMISAGAIVLLFALFYAFIWSPIFGHLELMRKNVNGAEKMLAWMKSADSVIMELKKNEHTKTHPSSLVSFLSVVKDKVEESELNKSLSQLKQLGPDSIEVQFQKVNFDQAIIFLTGLLQNYDIHIAQFSATYLNVPGLTNLSIIVKVNS